MPTEPRPEFTWKRAWDNFLDAAARLYALYLFIACAGIIVLSILQLPRLMQFFVAATIVLGAVFGLVLWIRQR